MGYSSQAGQLILRTQTTPGTYESDTGTAGVGIRIKSGSMASNRELMIPDAEIGGGRDVPDAYLGAVSWGGTFDFYARVDALATLLSAALGTAASNVVTGVTTHTITPSDAAQLPFLSIEERVGDGLETYHYTDCVVNSLHIESDANGYLSGTVEIIGAKQTAGETPTGSPVWDTTPMFVGTNINVLYNSVALPAKSFSLDIANNFEDDDFRLGSFYLGDLTPKRREIAASFGLRHVSSALWRQATYGAAAAVAPGGEVVKDELQITALTYEDIVGGTPATKNTIDLTIPTFALKPFSFEASGDDVLENTVEGQALRVNPATDIITAVIKSAKATIS